MTDILAQRDSTGINYEPYDREFKLCIFEEPNVQGRNERYEFRCDAHLACCGRVCCVPTAEGGILPIPLWLLIPLMLIPLLLLLALLYLLYRLFCRKRRDKELVKRTATSTTSRRRTTHPHYYGEAGYRSIERAGDEGGDRERLFRDRASYAEMPNGHTRAAEEERAVIEQRAPYRRRSFHEEETFEEEFHEEIEVEQGEKGAELSSLDSRRL